MMPGVEMTAANEAQLYFAHQSKFQLQQGKSNIGWNPSALEEIPSSEISFH